MRNYLICWEDNVGKKWEMVEETDQRTFCLNLLYNETVKKPTIFIIPADGFISGIWLLAKAHKSNRVDFGHFFEDYGDTYAPPVIDEKAKPVLHEVHERHDDDTKYGWIAPDGRYFHCGYQGHSELADRICFGITQTNNAEHYLEEHGWCKIYKSLFDTRYSVYIGSSHTITDAQMQTLTNLGLENAKDISNMLIKE